MLSLPNDGFTVEIERPASDVAAFEAGTPHAGADQLDDQTPFKLGDGADNDHESAAQRTTGIDIFPEADVLDLQSI